MIKVQDYVPHEGSPEALAARDLALTRSIATMAGSRILAAALDARALRAKGVAVCDLTVGDYAPEQFRAPESFLQDLSAEILAGRNHYPPSDGIPEIQTALTKMYMDHLGVEFPARSIVICGGARPPIYALFRAVVEAGDTVVYPVPSWNNDYYSHLCDAKQVPLRTTPESNFMPTAAQIAEAMDSTVRMVCINSPLNPCGTVISEEALRGICEVIVGENKRRAAVKARPVFLLFDQVYWPLTFGTAKHVHPIALVPEIAPHVLYVDAISKWLVGTGLRLGWAIVPPHLYGPVRDFMGHVGGWAPRPVQAATAKFITDKDGFSNFQAGLRAQLQERLTLVREAFLQMRADGLPVDCTEPAGAIYAAVRINVIGKRTSDGQVLDTNDAIRKYLLREASVALVAFQAFSLWEDTGWFRVSVGAVGSQELAEALVRMRAAVVALQ